MKNCPNCGRPIKFEEKYARIVACGYCNSILEFGTGELSKIGEQSEFIDFPSIFEVGKDVVFKEKKVSVKGQLRYEYDGGFFDCFYVSIEGKDYYISEDDGTYKVFKEGEWKNSDISLLSEEVGSTSNIGGKDVFIQESGLFNLVSMKGYVNSDLIPGKQYEYLDGVYNGKMCYFEKIIGENKVRVSKEVEV